MEYEDANNRPSHTVMIWMISRAVAKHVRIARDPPRCCPPESPRMPAPWVPTHGLLGRRHAPVGPARHSPSTGEQASHWQSPRAPGSGLRL